MPSLLDRVKHKLNEASNAPAKVAIVEIPKDAKHYVCKNHFNIDNKGKEVICRVMITFLPNEQSRTCECGILYKRSL